MMGGKRLFFIFLNLSCIDFQFLSDSDCLSSIFTSVIKHLIDVFPRSNHKNLKKTLFYKKNGENKKILLLSG